MGSFAVVAFVLLLAVSYLLTRAFLIGVREEAEEEERTPLEVRKEQLLDAIREFDMDFATGKLSESDYKEMRGRYVADTADVMKQMAAAANRAVEAPVAASVPGPLPAPSSGAIVDVARPVDADIEDEIEREIAARKAALSSAGCPMCGTEPVEDDAFCRKCGTRLTPEEM